MQLPDAEMELERAVIVQKVCVVKLGLGETWLAIVYYSIICSTGSAGKVGTQMEGTSSRRKMKCRAERQQYTQGVSK
jgi:hypothetical protein